MNIFQVRGFQHTKGISLLKKKSNLTLGGINLDFYLFIYFIVNGSVLLIKSREIHKILT